jgi:hypothetical protein
VTVSVAAGQHVLVQSSASFYNAGGDLFVGVNYTAAGGNPPTYATGLPINGGQNLGISWIFTGLSAGTYTFGCVYQSTVGNSYSEGVTTTVLVF